MSAPTSGHPVPVRPTWANAALMIAGVTVVARIIGFVRYVVLAHTVGTTDLGDVYATANAVPNIVYEVVVGGALVAVVVPMVAGAGDPAKERATVAALHGWALLLLVPITAAMYLTSSWVIQWLLGGGASVDSTVVARDMLWVFLLQIPVYGATVVAQGALQSRRRFFAPAVAPAVSSLVVIASYLAYAHLAGDDRGSLSALTDSEFLMLSVGTTLGVVALLLVQVPALVKADLLVLPALRFPSGRSSLAWTLAWSGAVVVGAQWLAYAAAVRWSNVDGGEGSALTFVLGWTLFLLPWSILVLPITTVTFPRLSSSHASGSRDDVAAVTSQSTRAIVVGAAVGAAGLAAAADPLAAFMVERVPGVSTVAEMAGLLGALGVGVFAYGVQGHLVRVLAAVHRAPVAAAGSAVGWIVGVATAGWLVGSSGDPADVLTAIGAGFSVGMVVGAVLLAGAVRHLVGRAALDHVGRVVAACGGAALLVGILGGQLLDQGAVMGIGAWAQLGLALAVGAVTVVVVGAAAAVVDRGSVHYLLRRGARHGGVR